MAKVLTVTVIEGRSLAAKDKTGFSDPYVIVTVGDQKKKTKKIMQTLNPHWNESLSFENVDDRMRVDMKCKDWDKFGGHDFMGEFSIPQSDLHEAFSTGNPVEKWYPLMRRKDKEVVTGDIKIRLAFVANAPLAHVSAPTGGKPASNAHLSPAEIDTKIQSLMKQREALDSMTKAYERSGDAKSAQVSSQQVAQIDGELAQLRQQQGGGGAAPQPVHVAPPQPQPHMTHQPSAHPLPPPTQPNIGGGSAPPPPPPPPGPGGAVHHPQPPHSGVSPQPGHGVPQPGYGAPQPGFGAPQPGFGAPQPGYGAPQPGFGAPQPGFGAPQPGFGVPHHPSTGMMQPGGPAPPPRGVSNGGMTKVPTHGSSNRLSGMGVNPNVAPNQGGLPLPNHQPSERRLSGGMGGGNPKLVPPRQQPPTPPQPGMNTGGVPQPPSRTLPNPGGNRPMPPTAPLPQVHQKPRVRVLYDFPAENPGELHVSEGEIVEIDNADDTWFTATKNGVTGWFPTNYAERI